jgi:hypothetical protein
MGAAQDLCMYGLRDWKIGCGQAAPQTEDDIRIPPYMAVNPAMAAAYRAAWEAYREAGSAAQSSAAATSMPATSTPVTFAPVEPLAYLPLILVSFRLLILLTG